MEQLRRAAGEPAELIPAQPTPAYTFEDTTLYETHRGSLRFFRRLFNPILKLFFICGLEGGAPRTSQETSEIGWFAEAESLPAGFCTEPGLGKTISILLLAEQTLGPGEYLVQNGTMCGTPGLSVPWM